MKTALPENAKIAKEAKECMQECVSEFISFITSEGTFSLSLYLFYFLFFIFYSLLHCPPHPSHLPHSVIAVAILHARGCVVVCGGATHAQPAAPLASLSLHRTRWKLTNRLVPNVG